MTSHYAVLGALLVALATLVGGLSTRTTHGASDTAADGAAKSAFTARLTEASTLRFPHDVDSNSPGRRARFYMRGRSEYFIEFSTPD